MHQISDMYEFHLLCGKLQVIIKVGMLKELPINVVPYFNKMITEKDHQYFNFQLELLHLKGCPFL